MISLDQVLLLQQKVESAVAKIAELNQTVAQKEAENAALRSKCVELTNALSAKTEQFSSFQTDQSKIEEGILKALERLNAVESTVLSVAGAAAANATAAAPSQAPQVLPQTQVAAQPTPPQPAPEAEPEPPVSPDITVEQAMQIPEEETAVEESITPDISFDDAELSPEQPEDTSQGQFDIF